MRKTGSACNAVRGAGWLAVGGRTLREGIGITRQVGLDSKTVPHVTFERDVKPNAASMTEEGRHLLVGDEEIRAVRDVIGIARKSSEDLQRGCGRPLRESRGAQTSDPQQKHPRLAHGRLIALEAP